MIWSQAFGHPIEWRGPTVNKVTGGMYEYRGVILHIAEGSFEGTISWQRNPDADVQVEADACRYALARAVYGVPLQNTDRPTGYGLGYHAMGGDDWGGHYD